MEGRRLLAAGDVVDQGEDGVGEVVDGRCPR
ncbi:hypothetical protein RKD26_006171 [Streptomyces calvus]